MSQLHTLVITFFVGAIIMFLVSNALDNRKLSERFNVWFRKGRIVKVNFVTSSGRNRERFIVPDSRGLMHIDGGTYPFVKDVSIINSSLRVPEVWVLENQPHPISPTIVRSRVINEIASDGTLSSTESDIPYYYLQFADAQPEKLKEKTAKELGEMLKSKIVDDIIRAGSKDLQRMSYILYATLAVLGLQVISSVAIWSKLSEMMGVLLGL